MVKRSYQDIGASYKAIRRHACNQTAQSVIILVATEVDAMAAARMLTQLLRSDNIVYSMQPVSNKQHIEQEIAKFASTIKTVFMINCGATLNVPKLFRLDEADVDYRVYVLDNHRPFHLANIYSRSTTLFCMPDQPGLLRWEDNYAVPEEGDGDDLSEKSDEDDDDLEDDEEEQIIDDDDVEDDDEDGEAEADFGDDGEAEDGAEAEDAEDAEDGGAEQLDDAQDGQDPQDGQEGDAADDAPKDGSDAAPELELAEASSSAEAPQQRKKRRRLADGGGDDEGEEEEEDDGAMEDQEAGRGYDEGVGGEEDDDEDGHGRGAGEDYGEGEGDTSGEAPEGDEDEDEEHVHVGGKRKRVTEPQRRKDSIRDYYSTRHTFCGVTSYIMLELMRGTSGSHIQLDNIWQAILGVTDQYQRQRIPEFRYNEMCADLKMRLSDHLAASEAGAHYLVAREGEGELQVQGSKVGHIKETPEFRFFMYKHWSLYDSMSFSPYVAAKLGAWQSQGAERLKELLAKLGMPLQQCKQSYNFMDPKLREHFRKKIQDLDRQQFKLADPEVMYTSFCRFNSYKNPVVAFDVVLAAQAILEACTHTTSDAASSSGGGSTANSSSSSSSSSSNSVVGGRASRHQAFCEAYDCLATKNDVLLKKGAESAIAIQKMVVTRARVMLEGSDGMEKLRNLYWAKVNCTREAHSRERVEGGMGSPFERPMVLTRLGQYIMDVKQNQSRSDGGWIGPRLMPLILSFDSENSDTAIVVGVCPIYMKAVDASGMLVEKFESSLGGADIDSDNTNRLLATTNFRKYFRMAAKEAHAGKYSLVADHKCNEHFDTNTIELHRNDLDIFVRTLDLVLTNVRRAVKI